MAFFMLNRNILKSGIKYSDFKNFVSPSVSGVFNSVINNNGTGAEYKQLIHTSSMKTQEKYFAHNKFVTALISANNLSLQYQQKASLHTRDFSSKEKLSKQKLENEYETDSDSDSEEAYEKSHPKGKEKGDSDFWRRKMRTLHGILDVNKDGVISFEDLMLLSKRFTDLGHLSPKTSEEFLELMKKTWEDQWGEITPYNLVTAEQFLSDMHHVLNDKELVKNIGKFLPYFFKAVDIDHSGYLDLHQYKLFFNCLGLSDEDAAVSFAVIDKNGDGKLTLKEFVKLGREFFLTEDERKVSKMFWGPLANH